MTWLIPGLYAVSLILLAAAAAVVYRKDPHSPLHRHFAVACLALIAWLLSLYWLFRLHEPDILTMVGRANFASVLWATFLGFIFVRELLQLPVQAYRQLLLGVLVLSAVTLATPLVDRAEYLHGSDHVTRTGPLFALFLCHVVTYPALSLHCILRARHDASRRLRAQLSVIGLGIFVAAAVNILTGLVLPYGLHNFGYEEVGALSVVALAASIAYSLTVQHLFDVRLVVRRTVVFAVIVALVEKAYSGLIELLVHVVPVAERTPVIEHAITIATVVFIAASFQPIKRRIERVADRLLYRRSRK